jgi:two-component system sensor histidine kinase/response regulator
VDHRHDRHTTASDRELCLQAGMNDHIAKPIDPDQLFGVLLHWIRRGSEEKH